MSGYTAVILVSDGKKNVGVDTAKAAQELNNRSGDRFCFYTVLVEDYPAGEAMYFNYFCNYSAKKSKKK